MFQFEEADLVLDKPPLILPYYRPCYGLDVGWEATAMVRGFKDPDSGNVFITDEYEHGGRTPAEHAREMQALTRTDLGQAIWGVIDPAARGASQSDGKRLIEQYQRLGLKLNLADNAVEAGIHSVQQLMSERRLKISPTCRKLVAQLGRYHRNARGKVVKISDHLVDGLRYMIHTDRFMPPPGHKRPRVIRSMDKYGF